MTPPRHRRLGGRNLQGLQQGAIAAIPAQLDRRTTDIDSNQLVLLHGIDGLKTQEELQLGTQGSLPVNRSLEINQFGSLVIQVELGRDV